MAKAKIKNKTKRRVKMTLAINEAATLLHVMTRIGGHSVDSPRQQTEAIKSALEDAGIEYPEHRTSDTNKAIYFYNFDGFTHTHWGF